MEVPMALCGEDHKRLLDRLSRIEGQVCGIRRMVEDDRSCMEVLKQIAAVSGAIRGVGMLVLEDHLKGCVSDALRGKKENEALIDEVLTVFNKFVK
jgi:DNA-binding FrmR family transcriptional regulator